MAVPVRARAAFTAPATLGIFADFARQVGGDRVDVIQLLGDGVDPHDYQMVPNDLTNINRSQVLFYNGYNLEPWLSGVLAGAAGPGLRLVPPPQGPPPILPGAPP